MSFASKTVAVNAGGKAFSIPQGMEIGANFSLFKNMIACDAVALLQPLLIDLHLMFHADDLGQVILSRPRRATVMWSSSISSSPVLQRCWGFA